jgi:4'-phosphopantetheinyl transferase
VSVGLVNIVWLNLDQPIDVTNELRSLMSPEEKRRLSRISNPLQRRQAIVRVARRRQVISELCGVEAHDIVFESDSRGRPMVVYPRVRGLEFSVSHCADISVIAVTHGLRIGVDVESLAEIPDSPNFMTWVASKPEVEQISKLPSSLRHAAKLRLWTRKEAYLKATGEGIGGGIGHLEVPLIAEPWNLPFTPFLGSAEWSLFGLECPRQGFEAALVMASGGAVEAAPDIVTTHI